MIQVGTKTLSDVCELIVDCEHKTAPTQQTGYLSIRTPNIGRGRLILDGVNRVSDQTYREWTKRATPQPGDLIMAREAPIGNVAIIPPGLQVCLGQRTLLIRPNPSFVDPQYLVYLLLGDEIQGRIQSLSNGATVHHLNMSDIRDLVLPELLPLPTQRKIAAILSAYDGLIENNTRRIAILEAMAQALYREWFVHYRFPGHEACRMVDSPLGPIPEGWAAARLRDVAAINESSIRRGHEPEEITYIDISSVSPGKIEKVEPLRFTDAPGRARRIVRHRDIIWSMVRPNRRSYALILNPTPNLIASTGFAVISPHAVPFTYLYHAVTSTDFVAYLTNHTRGAAYPAVTAEDFEEAVILRPPADLLGRFDDEVEDMLTLRENYLRRNITLRCTRDLLLPKLISGEADIEQLDIAVEGEHA